MHASRPLTTASSKTPIFESAPFGLDDNADWLITTIPSGGVLGQLAPELMNTLTGR